MCGIVGVASGYTNGFTQYESDMFRDMLFLDTLRGFDSTGVFGVLKNKDVHVHKEASDGPRFIQTKEFGDFRQKLFGQGLFAVGHNRAATRGSVKDENAHPFVIDDKIILVQNGTYFGSHKHHKDTEVDTEAVAHVIAENEDIAEALRKINAAYALVWYNTQTQCLHMIRNDLRPLYIASEKGRANVFFASEGPTIAYAAARNKVVLEQEPVIIPTHTLVTCKRVKEHFEYSTEKINSEYKHTFQGYSTGWVGGHYRSAHNDGNSEMTYPFVGKTGSGSVNSHHNPVDVRHSFIDVAMSSIHECWLEDGVGLPLINDWRDAVRASDGNAVIELDDFKPANASDNCSTWWVHGHWIRPREDLDRILVYWQVRDKTKEEMINYVVDTFYSVELGSASYRKFDMYQNDYSIITVQGMNPQPIPTLEVNNVTTH